MAENVEIRVGVDDKATPALKRVAATAREIERADKEAASKRLDAFNEADARKREQAAQRTAFATGAIGVAMAGVTVASGAFIAAMSTSYTKASEASAAYLEYKRALDSVEDSLYRAGVASEALTGQLDSLNSETARLARLSEFDQPELLKSLSKIIDLSGQASQAQKGLGLAVAISTKRGEDLDEVSEKVALALKGEIAALEDLTPLTGQQADALRKIESDSARAVKAIELLEAQYGGLLTGQDRTWLATRALQVAQDDLVGSIGQVVTESGALAVVQESATRIIDRMTGAVGDNSAELKLLILDVLDEGIKIAGDWSAALGRNADILAGGVTVIRLGAGALGIYLNVLQIVSKAMISFSTLLISGVVKGMEQLLWVSGKVASVVDDDLAESLRLAADGAAGVSERFMDISADAFVSASEDLGDINAQFEAMGKALDQQDLVESGIRRGLKVITDEASTARTEIAKLRAEADKPSKRRAVAPEAPKKPASVVDPQKVAAEEAAKLRLKALDTQDKEIRAALEYQAKLKEIEGQQLKGAQAQLARAQAALDAERALDEALNDRARAQAILLRLETAGVEARTKDQQARAIEVEYQAKLVELRREDITLEERALKTRELALERQLALRELEAEAIDRQAAGWERVASGVTSAASGAEGYGKLAGEGLGALVQGFGEVSAIAKRSEAGILSAAEATQQGLQAAGGAAVSFASALGASAAEQAGILAVFETASAIASFAVGDLAGGGQHLVAAGLYTAVAAMGGGSAPTTSGASGGAGGGASAQAAAPREQRGEQDQRRGARVIAEEIAAALGGQAQPITVIYDYRGSFNADSPAGERMVYNLAQRGGRQRGVRLDDLRHGRLT